jgi:L-lactate dehydrogenase complex protein LldE
MRVALFVPCFVDILNPEVAVAVCRVLSRLGHEVICPEGQTCCGQPALNAGFHGDAECLARRLLDLIAKESPDAVVSPSGSCVSALRTATGGDHELLDRVFEFSQFLTDELGVTDVGARFTGRVTWHDACHPLRELGIRAGPRKLLAAVGGLELREMDPSEECCGFGGTFAVKAPLVSTGMGERKLRAIEASGADFVASTESSCLMQIGGLLKRRGSSVRPIHLAEILAGAGDE